MVSRRKSWVENWMNFYMTSILKEVQLPVVMDYTFDERSEHQPKGVQNHNMFPVSEVFRGFRGVQVVRGNGYVEVRHSFVAVTNEEGCPKTVFIKMKLYLLFKCHVSCVLDTSQAAVPQMGPMLDNYLFNSSSKRVHSQVVIVSFFQPTFVHFYGMTCYFSRLVGQLSEVPL